jgi:hypothetical protein
MTIRSLACRTLLAAMTAFAIAGASSCSSAMGAVLSIDWRTSPLDLDLRGMNGTRYRFRCPPGKPDANLLTGSGTFTDASSICTAATQAGAIRAASGGPVTIEIRPGLNFYAGGVRNFVRSNSYAAPWAGSFIVVAPGIRRSAIVRKSQQVGLKPLGDAALTGTGASV